VTRKQVCKCELDARVIVLIDQLTHLRPPNLAAPATDVCVLATMPEQVAAWWRTEGQLRTESLKQGGTNVY
jgi:hypothetical protein